MAWLLRRSDFAAAVCMPPGAACRSRCKRATKRSYCALLMAIATIFAITLLGSLWTSPTAAAAAAAAADWAGHVAPVPMLHQAPVAELRQATSIDWRACLAPQDGLPPMTKEEFLQQKPARCSRGSVL